MFLQLIILLILIVFPSSSYAAKPTLYDWVVGGSIKTLAKLYVKTSNLPKLKTKYKAKIIHMRDDKFRKYFMKFYVVYEQLPQDLKEMYRFSNETSKSEVIGMIDRVQKKDLITIINKIPSDFIVNQTRHYAPPLQNFSHHPPPNEMMLWRHVIEKI